MRINKKWREVEGEDLPGAVIPWRLKSPISFHKLTSWNITWNRVIFYKKLLNKNIKSIQDLFSNLWEIICFVYCWRMRSNMFLGKLCNTFFELPSLQYIVRKESSLPLQGRNGSWRRQSVKILRLNNNKVSILQNSQNPTNRG